MTDGHVATRTRGTALPILCSDETYTAFAIRPTNRWDISYPLRRDHVLSSSATATLLSLSATTLFALARINRNYFERFNARKEIYMELALEVGESTTSGMLLLLCVMKTMATGVLLWGEGFISKRMDESIRNNLLHHTADTSEAVNFHLRIGGLKTKDSRGAVRQAYIHHQHARRACFQLGKTEGNGQIHEFYSTAFIDF